MKDSHLTVTAIAEKFIEIQTIGSEMIDENGVTTCTFKIPDDAKALELSASFVSSSGLSAEASLMGLSILSPRNRQLQIDTSTFDASPGENMIFHVRNNFFIKYFNFMIVANGQVIYCAREYISDINVPSITSFSLPASSEMTPIAKILAWVVDQDNDVVADSLAVFVNPLSRHQVSLLWNEHKDHSGGSVEITFKGEIGSFFCVHSLWEETYMMDSGNDIDATRVYLQMMNLDVADKNAKYQTLEEMEEAAYGSTPNIRRAYSRSRYGYGSSIKFFPTTVSGPDVPTTFNFSDVVLFTDAMIYYHPSKATGSASCDARDNNGIPEQFRCLTGGCYLIEKRCDGVSDCPDSSDESGCSFKVDPLRDFRLHRINRLDRFYASQDGDWAWRDVRRVRDERYTFSIPKIPQHWVFSFFAVGTQNGLGILEIPVQFNSAFTFTLNVHAPKVVRMWEQVGLLVGVFNFHCETVAVMITVPESPDYRTIQVESKGIVSSYDPKRVEGTLQHLIWLPAGESEDVAIPLVFLRMGRIEITVKGDTQMQSDSHTFVIEVIPEGAYIPMHTSLMFDLKDRALVYEFLNINLDESPIIPYKLQRRFIFGTPRGHISVTGDIVGPVFTKIPENEGNLLGFGVMGAETTIFNFASNIWSLHYLRLTNQLTEEKLYQVLTSVNVYYAELSRYQSVSGGFFNWVGSEESVWLTAYALKNLWIANFQDWENHIFIDPSIICLGVEFLLKYQTVLGSFQETSHYLHPLDPKFNKPSYLNYPNVPNIALTAHVVITLKMVMISLRGDLHRKANQAMINAVRYLERVLQNLTDPYDLAVTTWALTTADSKEKNVAFSALDRMKRVYGDRVYWAREPIEFHSVAFENNQRPYLQPKCDNKWDAHAVEATSYALLAYVKREGIGILQENIVRFLSSMRQMDGGIISSVDSLAAKEALVEYSYRARIRDLTDMRVHIECSADPNSTFKLNIKNANEIAKQKSFELEKLFGHITVVGRGSGQALLQLHYTYHVDAEEEKDIPLVRAFEINVKARYNGINSSQITITSCQRWINTQDAETSGLTVVEIHLPSGYKIVQNKLTAMVHKKAVPNLRWAYLTSTDIKFFFNKLDSDTVCFTYKVYRRFPVSNHSRYGSVRIYELFQPERFQMELFEVYPLYSLDICEVCGSYQCPYCPFYSDSTLKYPSMVMIVTCYLCLIFNDRIVRHVFF